MLTKFEQNHMVQTIQNFDFFDGTHFWHSVDAILEDVYVTETIFNAKLSSLSAPKITVVWHV